MNLTEPDVFFRFMAFRFNARSAVTASVFFLLCFTNLSFAQNPAIEAPTDSNSNDNTVTQSIGQNATNPRQASFSQSFDGYPATRVELLNLVSRTKKSLRIVTDFFSDGEMASSLFIAQYRKVDVKVMLGQGRANQIFSRLGFLKEQGIPVWMRPKGFYSESTTLIAADGVLYTLNADLDSSARHRKFTLTSIEGKAAQVFKDAFDVASIGGIVPQARRLPQVGRSRPDARVYRPEGPVIRDPSKNPTSNRSVRGSLGTVGADESDLSSGESTFRYSNRGEKPSTGVPTKLPRSTILQERATRGAPPESGDQN